MNAPTVLEAHRRAKRLQEELAETAREIVAEKPVDRRLEADARFQEALKCAAQLYLDNLSDGFDEPDELLELLAQDEPDNRSQILNTRRFYYPRSILSDSDAAYDEARELCAERV